MKILITIICLCMATTGWADELEPLAVPIPHEVSRSLSYDAPPAYDPNEPATITVLMVFTTAAASYVDDTDAAVAAALDYAQVTADNSQVGITFDVVGIVETDYVESGDSGTDLRRLTEPADGWMDEVHEIRDNLGADLVMLLGVLHDTGGLGWLMTLPQGNSHYGFCMVRVQQMSGSTPVHEIGHNLGLHHSKLQNVQPGPGVFTYSAGGRWIGSDDVPYCSVMTYTGGSYFEDGVSHSRIPIFSNPRLLHLSSPTGDVVDADNARTAMEMKHYIAAYRHSNGQLQVTLEPSEGQWRVVDSEEWQDSGDELSLPVGPTEIEFGFVVGWVTPTPITVLIEENELATSNVIYEVQTHIVTAIPLTGGQITPPQWIVDYGDTAAFEVLADEGYTVGAVTGCGGSLSGSTYTTGAITGNCNVTAQFDEIPEPVVPPVETRIVLVAPTVNGHIAPSQQVVNYGDTAIFQVVPDSGYSIGAVFGCGGSLSESTYITGVITENCTITAQFDKIIVVPPPVVPLVVPPVVPPVTTSSGGGGGGGCFIGTIWDVK